MSNPEVLLIGNPALWERSTTIRDPRSADVAELERRLAEALDALRRVEPEILSIGAPQIGEPLRMCRIQPPDAPSPITLINPWVVEASLETDDVWEHCASIPNLRFGIRRFQRVTVEYVDRTGTGRSLTVEGEAAALLQHEIDHFNGFLVTDRLNDSRLIAHRKSGPVPVPLG